MPAGATVDDGDRVDTEAVELVSPGNKSMDRKFKPLLYAEAGIEYYWRLKFATGRYVDTAVDRSAWLRDMKARARFVTCDGNEGAHRGLQPKRCNSLSLPPGASTNAGRC
ncbi:hypothetical protein ACFXPJ_14685 [Streptomyces goshikiensis]